jgi:Tfp pilus assembly protein PilN
VSQVNLLPPELRQKQTTRRTTLLVGAGGAVVVVLVLLFSFMKASELSQKQEDLAAQQAVNDRVSAQIAELQKFGQLQAELQTKQQLISTVFTNEVSWSGILLDVSRVIPADAYLTAFTGRTTPPTATGTTGAATGLVGSLTFTGSVKGADTLAAWLTRLEQMRGWVNAWAHSATESGPFTRIYQFQSGVDLTTDAVTRRGKGVEP